MASPMAARQQRLAAIAGEWGIGPLPAPVRLTKPLQPLSVRTPSDDAAAEDLLKRRRLAAAADGGQNQRSPALKRAFTTSKRKEWDSSEIFAALDAYLDPTSGSPSPGVAEALVVKLLSVGGDPNIASTKTKTNVLTRRKSIESFERSRLLQRAIQHQNPELVAVLVPHADPLTLDHGLPHAILSGHADVVEHLLRYGASTTSTAAGQDAFRQVCSAGGRPDLVSLLLASDGRPGPAELSPAMVDAAKRGCLESVLHLSRATADGGYNNAAALQEAMTASRVDIALAIVTGSKPPSSHALNEAFKLLFSLPSILPNEKMALAEILLCAGAGGDIVSLALAQACFSNFSEMVSLLVYYGASVEYDNAAVLRYALSQNRFNLAQILLSDGVVVSPQRASECVMFLPKQISNEERAILLNLLLRKGAGGSPLNDCLIDATEAGDVESVRLLLSPHFHDHSGSPASPSPSSHRRTLQRHHTASVNYKDGVALQLAVQTADFDIVDLILATRPAPDIMAEVFPNIFNLAPEQRYNMIERFLATGFSGPVVTAALQQAMLEQPSERDQRLITLLLRSNADVNFGGGAGIVSAVVKNDVQLLNTILQNSQPAIPTLAAALSEAIAVDDPAVRRQMVFSLLSAGVSREQAAVAKALVTALSSQPIDIELLDMLLKKGMADINYNAGSSVVLAAGYPDPSLLERLLQTNKANQQSLVRGLYALRDVPSAGPKAAKLALLLRYTNQKEALDDLLVSEIQTVVKSRPHERFFPVVQMLLSAGADVNAHSAASLCHAVAAPDAQIVEMLLKSRPSPASLAQAIPRIFNISDAMDRYSLAKMLVGAGVPAYEASRALNHTVVKLPDDLPLLKILAAAADAEDRSAIFSAVKQKRSNTLKTILNAKKFSVSVLNAALAETMKITEKEPRQALCALLVEAGASGSAVSDALLSAAADADLSLGSILLANGASADHKDGEAIVLACRSGSSDVLEMLLKSPSVPNSATLRRGFQEAEQVDNLKAREATFRLLLERGVSGEPVDKQLITAASYGDDGLGIVRLLLKHGASTDYKNGEAVWTSTRSGFLNTLKLLLRIDDDDTAKDVKRQQPSQETMTRALKASWMLNGESRYQIMQWLFQAGLQPTEAVHIALNKAVKEENPNLDLVRLLLSHGASPLVNGCQTLVDAAYELQVSILKLCMSSEIRKADLDYAFAEAFASSRADVWLSDDGFATAKLLLEKGAHSDELARVLVTAIDHLTGEREAVAKQFVQLLVEHRANVNIDRGLPLQAAAILGRIDVVRLLLTLQPDADSVSMAFPCIFEAGASENDVVKLIEMFSEHKAGDAEDGLDVMFKHPEYEPVVFLALAQYSRSVKIAEALFDAGYYHDQMTAVRVAPEMEEDETVTLLFWALLQPQKKISSAVIELLIERGCKVNFETPVSKTTPLMLAIQHKRPDVVSLLMQNGADVNVADHQGNTPLFMAVRAGGDMGATMMSHILAAEPSKNDGSLHVAAQALNLKAMKMLVKHGHDVDFPSPLHGGRSALSEICLHGTDGGPLSASRMKELDHSIAYLIDQGSDIQLESDGKTPLLLALEANDAVSTTQALLKAGMYKFVNSPFNQYHDEKYTYSPTMYVTHVLHPASAVREKLLAALKMGRAQNVYYAHSGPQPAGAVNVPEELLRVERERQARLDRALAEEEERARTRRHTEELAQMAAQARQDELNALHQRAEAEAAAMRRRALAEAEAHAEAVRVRAEAEAQALRRRTLAEAEAQAEALRLRSQAEAAAQRLKASVDAEALQSLVLRREADHAADLEHTRLMGEAQLQIEGRKQQQLLTHEQQRSWQQVNTAQQISSITMKERRSLDKLDFAQNKREMARLAEGRMLANAIGQMPNGAGPSNRNVAGYIMGEIK